MFELAVGLGVKLRVHDEAILVAHPARPMASDEAYATALTDNERRALVDDDEDGVLADALMLLGEAAALLCPDAKTALGNAGLGDARRIAATNDAAAAAI